MKQLIIIRGPSGSGKSTAARAIQNGDPSVWIFEADNYFIGRDGQYKFIAEKIGQAHKYCQDCVRHRMTCGDRRIIVSNTTMACADAAPYLKLAEEFGYDVKIFRTKQPWDVKILAARNVHGVTEEIVQRQISRYQPLENEEEYVG